MKVQAFRMPVRRQEIPKIQFGCNSILLHTNYLTKSSQHFKNGNMYIMAKNRKSGRSSHNALDKVEFTSTAIGRKSEASVQINMCTGCSPAFFRNANVSSSWSSPCNNAMREVRFLIHVN